LNFTSEMFIPQSTTVQTTS